MGNIILSNIQPIIILQKGNTKLVFFNLDIDNIYNKIYLSKL